MSAEAAAIDLCPHIESGLDEPFAVVTLRPVRRQHAELVGQHRQLCVYCSGRVSGALREAAELEKPPRMGPRAS